VAKRQPLGANQMIQDSMIDEIQEMKLSGFTLQEA
jgi:hypothetical protein